MVNGNLKNSRILCPRLEVEDEEMIEHYVNGMEKVKDNELEGEYKVDQGGNFENWTFHWNFCHILVYHGHSSYWQK